MIRKVNPKGMISLKVKVRWTWSLVEGAMIAIPLILLFINWKYGLTALAIDGLIILLYSLLILYIGLNTKAGFGAAKVIELAGTRKLKDKEKKTLKWVQDNARQLGIPDAKPYPLHGYLLEPEQTPKGLIYMCHGFGDYSFTSVFDQATRFYEMGYSVFLTHSRGFGSDNGNWTGMGTLEREDHVRWIETLEAHNPDLDIFLYGVSMGAASVMNLSDLEDPQIKGIIEDCGYVSLYEQMDHALLSVLQVPEYPTLPICEWLCKRVCKFSMKDLDVRPKLARTIYPILAFHGREDDFVPFSNLDQVIQAAGPHLRDAYFIEGAAHCQSACKEPQFYWTRIQDFLEEYGTTPADTEQPIFIASLDPEDDADFEMNSQDN